MKKPRPFIHKLIYVDERQERLNEIEQRARQETQPLMVPHTCMVSLLQHKSVSRVGDKHGAFLCSCLCY